MARLNDFWQVLKTDLADFAEGEFRQWKDQALSDATVFTMKMKSDLERWMGLWAAGKITQEEFKELLEAKKELLAMEALTEAGLSQVRRTKFVNGLLGVVVGAAKKVI